MHCDDTCPLLQSPHRQQEFATSPRPPPPPPPPAPPAPPAPPTAAPAAATTVSNSRPAGQLWPRRCEAPTCSRVKSQCIHVGEGDGKVSELMLAVVRLTQGRI